MAPGSMASVLLETNASTRRKCGEQRGEVRRTCGEARRRGHAACSEQRGYAKRMEYFSDAIALTSDNDVLYSNRSAAFKHRSGATRRRPALNDAERTATAHLGLGDASKAIEAYEKIGQPWQSAAHGGTGPAVKQQHAVHQRTAQQPECLIFNDKRGSRQGQPSDEEA
ncbi:uncharacterized protein [Miscanthus floridulus]|uniref:uncharacterized protein n=1 Tax=Miscanthus floridulus TaxID=154761 RepID=UPI00345B44D1